MKITRVLCQYRKLRLIELKLMTRNRSEVVEMMLETRRECFLMI